ncbi:GntR family transcriptional regulator [Leisingera sp.]|uniref:GntR family transcriptional regulator n=1 Tax=Leisingera sp. TaxID=1879318 RepID=UPI003A952E0A
MKVLERESLGDRVYDQIASGLLSGRMRPNDKLTIRGLAEELGVSSTPVRDAVIRLTQDRVLEQRSSKDVRVPVMSISTYLEILDIRLELEGLAAARAAERADAAALKSLEKLLARSDRAIEQRNWTTAAELNQEFHLSLCVLAEMPTMHGILRGLWLRMGPLIACYYDTEPDGLNTAHHNVLEAMRTRSSQQAREAIRRDICTAREAMITQLELLGERLSGAKG